MGSGISREEVMQQISHHRFLPLFNSDDRHEAREVLDAAYAGGVRVFEFTNRSPHAFEVFSDLASHSARNMPDLLLGAGTITDPGMAESFIRAGAKFIVLPMIREQVAAYCRIHDIFWMPGCGTLTEIAQARDLGADMVKIFPAELLGGSRFLEAIRAPCPWVKAMPTGGVDGTEENLRGWFAAGAICVGMGSRLFTKDIMARKDFTQLKKNIASITACIARIKEAGDD
jgi:2-dehydro-3-deoxyphosphogluconate aldolase/(4S)-4-hydroxy-2-oxoglutarate aldolase